MDARTAQALRLLTARTAAGALVRRLLPVTLGVPLVVGALRLVGQEAGLYSTEVGVAITTFSAMAVAAPLLLWVALSVERAERGQKEADAELRRSRAEHRALARNFPDGAIVLFDRELRHLIADGTGLADVGLSSAAMEGRTIWEVFPAGVCAVIEPPYRAALAGGASTFEYQYGRRTYFVRVVPVRDDESGEIWSGAATVQDVSDRKREETELREASDRFASIFENAPIGEAIVAPDGRWLRVNRALCDLVGYSEDELLRTSFQDITHPDDLDADLGFVSKMLSGEIQAYQMEKRYVHKDGRPVWIQLSVSLVRGDDGEPLHFISQIEGIDERRLSEQRLREAEERYRTLVEQLPLVTYIQPLDLERANIYASPQVEHMLGYPAELWQTDPKLLEKIVHPDDLERVLAAARHVRASGEPFRGEYRYVRPGGEVVWVQDETYLVRDKHGNPARVEGYLLDISDRKRAEAERDRLESDLLHAQKLEAIGQLAGGVAHEFNNMLMAIRGHSDLMLQRLAPTDALRRDVEQIARSAERAAELTRQLLAFGRKQVLTTRSFDLNETVDGSVRLLRPLIDPGIELTTALEPRLPPANADPAQLEQVLVNLVLNARDAIAGRGSITIRTTTVAIGLVKAASEVVEPGPYLTVSVEDNGCGMDEQTCARIFEPFFTTKGVGAGTGLGLSTSYGIVRQCGGFLTAQSVPGRGTTMTVSLPVAQAERQARAVRGRALVVDDEPAVRRVCAELLARLGFEVEGAADGEAALAFLEQPQTPLALLLTDVVMPGVDGRELARRARLLHPTATIICMSGHAGARGVDLPDVGDAVVLQKPFTSGELEAVIPSRVQPFERQLTCVVADDHPSVLDAVCRFLVERDICVVGRALDVREALDEVSEHTPDVAVLDFAMPGPGGVAAAVQAREASPATQVVLYTGHPDGDAVAEAFAAGARGFVLKSAPLEELARAIGVVGAGGVYVDPSLGAAPPTDPATPEPTLTAREQEVLGLIANGNTNEQVASTLTLSPDTVQTHVRNAMKKLGAETRTQAVATAMRRALIR